ncbi:MAG: toxin-antitoxin system protein [Schwartzia sp.]|nr:toxin-antitoxin system protein [Schwartzia sp. (in: firmicutes)]MBO6211020.1 toxin-antitoxin system protein [Schwartzia sp. (in: firmicutes)]MBP3690041.1 toxin-antitoxin system protein [Schwartzia sp. (in: firmicutes)]
MNMALREEAVRMMDALPDDGIRATILYMSEYRRKQEEEKKRIDQNRAAFDDLMSFCRPAPIRDEKQELAESREERFGHADID